MTDADVIRLLVPLEANFMTATKQGQWAVTGDTLRLLAHNKSADTLDLAISDDSLQCLLAGTQTLTGIKTFTNNVGIGRSANTRLDLYHATNNVACTLETDKTDGSAYNVFTNDTTSWSLGISSTDLLEIKNSNDLDSVGAAAIGIATTNYVCIGDRVPITQLDVYSDDSTVKLTLETDRVNGLAYQIYTNDAASWSTGIDENDNYLIKNSTILNAPLTETVNIGATSLTINNDLITWTASTKALYVTHKEVGGNGYVDASTARSNEIDITNTGMVTVSSSGYIDNDETGGIYIGPNSTIYARWDTSDDTWYYTGVY